MPANHPSISASAAFAPHKTSARRSSTRPCARPPRDRVPRVGQPGTAGQRTRLLVHRRGQPAGAFQAGRRRRAPRRRGHHNRSRASRSTPGRHTPALRPALLGTTNPPPRDRNGAPAGRTDHRLAGRGPQPRSPAGRSSPCPIHRWRSAHRWRKGCRAAIDGGGLSKLMLKPVLRPSAEAMRRPCRVARLVLQPDFVIL